MLFKPEFKTKFQVEKVHFEPNAISRWTLKHPCLDFNLEIDEVFCDTTKEDEKLKGDFIEAQIDLDWDKEERELVGKEKSIIEYKHSFYNVLNIVFTGQIKREIVSESEGLIYYSYHLDSIFPLHLRTSDKQNYDKGQWISVEGELFLILPRRGNLEG